MYLGDRWSDNRGSDKRCSALQNVQKISSKQSVSFYTIILCKTNRIKLKTGRFHWKMFITINYNTCTYCLLVNFVDISLYLSRIDSDQDMAKSVPSIPNWLISNYSIYAIKLKIHFFPLHPSLGLLPVLGPLERYCDTYTWPGPA